MTVRVSPSAKLLLNELFQDHFGKSDTRTANTALIPMSKRDLPQSFFTPPVARRGVVNAEGTLTGKFVHEMPRGGLSKAKRGPRKQSRSRSKSAQGATSSQSFKPIGSAGEAAKGKGSAGEKVSAPQLTAKVKVKVKVRSRSANGGRSSASAKSVDRVPRTPSRENKRGSPSIGVGMIPIKSKKHRPQSKHGTPPQTFTSTSLDKKLSAWFPGDDDGELDDKGALQAEMAQLAGNHFDSYGATGDGRGGGHSPIMGGGIPRGGYAVGGEELGSINFTIGNVTTPWRDPVRGTPDSRSSSAFDELLSPTFDVPSNELDGLQMFGAGGFGGGGGRRGSDSGTGSARWRPDSCPEMSTAMGGLRTYTPAIPEQVEPQHLQSNHIEPQRSLSAEPHFQQGHHQGHHHFHQQQNHNGGHHTPSHHDSPHHSPLTHLDSAYQHGGGGGGGHGHASPPMMGTVNEYDEFLSPQPVTFGATVPNQHAQNPWQPEAFLA